MQHMHASSPACPDASAPSGHPTGLYADSFADMLCGLTMLQAEKRRETLLVSMNKTKDALSVTEEKYKSLQLDMQRTQMDLLAKTSKLAYDISNRCICRQ